MLTPPFCALPLFVHEQGSCQVTQGYSGRPSPRPLRGPYHLQGCGRYVTPCPCPLSHTDAPLFAQETHPPFAPCPPFVREQGPGRRPLYAPPLRSPRHLQGRRRVSLLGDQAVAMQMTMPRQPHDANTQQPHNRTGHEDDGRAMTTPG
jgi:hypothetical protein